MASKFERRRRKRIDVALPIKIEYNKERLSAETKNISDLGTYIEIDKKIPIGTTLDIRLEIPKKKLKRGGEKKLVNCKGVAFRCHPALSPESKKRYGIGIFFRSFLKSGEKDLSNYIDYILLEEKRKGKIYMRKRKRKAMIKRKGGKR